MNEETGYSPYSDSRAVVEEPRDERVMRVVELVVAGIALLASILLSFPK